MSIKAESEFIAREQQKLDARLLRRLHKVRRTGWIGPRRALETLLANDLVIIGPPTNYLRYNHYRLTQRGVEEVRRLESQVIHRR